MGPYSIGAPLARLSDRGAEFRLMQRAVRIEPGVVHTENIYSGRPDAVTGFDTVVIAFGGVPDAALYLSLKPHVEDLHVLGDAYAPRRISFATRQAYDLVRHTFG